MTTPDYLEQELAPEQLQKLHDEAAELFYDFLLAAAPPKDGLMVIGCSTSEILGGHIGKNGSRRLGEVLAEAALAEAESYGLTAAAQCCEHLNRALVIEKAAALRHRLTIVSAVPKPTAGGSFAAAFYQQLQEPVLVESIQADCGLDIGQTLIGMHLRRVAVPLRLTQKNLGPAIITAATCRPPLIGGERAEYK